MGSAARKVDVEKRPFCKRLLSLSGRYNIREIWSDFITMLACAISNSVDKSRFEDRESMYLRIISKYEPDERGVFPQLVADLSYALYENPDQDFLGSAYMELEMGNSHAGQFFTPYDICVAMASIGLPDLGDKIEQQGYVSINDCACGAGATLIAAANTARNVCEHMDTPKDWRNHVLLVGQDIDFIVGMMCYIQMSFIGAAGYVKIGNSLTDPMTTSDESKNYWYTPMYFSPVWRDRRIAHAMDQFIDNVNKTENRSTSDSPRNGEDEHSPNH